jgi:parallel beta-helix repeat protein
MFFQLIIIYLVPTGFVQVVVAQQPKDMVNVVSHNSFVDEAEYLHVVGEVQNNSTSGIRFVQVIGTFYDTNNRVVGTGFTFTQPRDLLSGRVAPFELILTSASVPMGEIDHYRLRLIWREATGMAEVASNQDITGLVGESQQQVGQLPQGPIACGQLVHGSVTLTANITCTGDGLIVGDDGTTINLNGFSIYGPGADSSKVGIGVSEDNVVINGPGTISGFQAGILATEANELVATSLIMQNNQIAAFFTGADFATVDENIIKNNNIGVASHTASGLNIEDNSMDGNTLAGITFVDTTTSKIEQNKINGSQNGIFLDSQSTENTVQSNNAHDNVVDVNNANGLAPNVNQNTFSDNNCQVSNPSGLCFGR